MARCSFCEESIKHGTGKIYVKKEGKILNLCGMKCEKNMMKLERRQALLKWTRASRKSRGAPKAKEQKKEVAQ